VALGRGFVEKLKRRNVVRVVLGTSQPLQLGADRRKWLEETEALLLALALAL
jgi:hypothetical protein